MAALQELAKAMIRIVRGHINSEGEDGEQGAVRLSLRAELEPCPKQLGILFKLFLMRSFV